MKVLVIGAGGREHAIVHKLIQSNQVDQVFCAPGNAGISQIAECIDIRITDIKGLYEFAKANNVDFTIVGSEFALSSGIVDFFRKDEML